MSRGNRNADVSERLEEILAKLAPLEPLVAQVASLKSLLEKSQEEVASLRTDSKKKDAEIALLKSRLNNLEQHHRGWSIRVNDLPLDPAAANDPQKVMETLYNKALLPILQGALQKGEIKSVPTCHQLLETAHILPGKDGRPKPIIARFFCRNDRALMFKWKRDFAPRAPSIIPGSRFKSPRMLYPIYEDLTKDNFNFLRTLSADSRTTACWSVGGLIRYKTANSDIPKKVADIYKPIEDLFK